MKEDTAIAGGQIHYFCFDENFDLLQKEVVALDDYHCHPRVRDWDFRSVMEVGCRKPMVCRGVCEGGWYESESEV